MNQHVTKAFRFTIVSISILLLGATRAAGQVRTESGAVEGARSADGRIHIFKGIPFAAPPIGSLRWKEPQPGLPWKDVRKATEFGARCMQEPIYSDMVFRDQGPSEDCLYLNIWTPKTSMDAKLPVMVWIYGGGFQAGATSEPRQDGEHLARRGVVMVSMSYRLGIFGFFSHPQLTAESPHHASGNYGLMDQATALKWVHKNIAAFGGDPNNITIFGESAGSFSVSAQMASPLSKDLIRAAIGESGALLGKTADAKSLAETEQQDARFAESIGANSIKQLRAMSARQILDAIGKDKNNFRFGPNIDGYFLPTSPHEIYLKGSQAHVPLLAGWNEDEGNYLQFFGDEPATKGNYAAKIRQRFGDAAADALKLFPAESDEQMRTSAGLLNTADFIAYGTWKWAEMHRQTGHAVIFRYEFDQAPPMAAEHGPESDSGAYHSAEIEYVFGTLDSKKLPWRPEDYKLSEQLGAYWTNFAKTGNPNGAETPRWPSYEQKDGYQIMHLLPNSHAIPDQQRKQFELLDSVARKSK